jgi:hypothetical protein
MRGHKLRRGVYWQGALKERGVRQVGHKTRPTCTLIYSADTHRLKPIKKITSRNKSKTEE